MTTLSNGELAGSKISSEKKTGRSRNRQISSMPAGSNIENGPPDMIVAAASGGEVIISKFFYEELL